MSPQFDLIALLLFVVGCIYAVHIYYHPPREGWTWVSVFVGVSFTCIGISALIATILIESDYWNQLWKLIFIPWFGFILTGVPMIVGQVMFKRAQERKINEIEGIINGK